MSDKKSLVVLILITLFILPFVYAEASFTFYSGAGVDPICSRSTGLFSDVIMNEGDVPLEFSVSNSGNAAVFSTTVPTGFTLMPGEIKNIYTYITPMSSVSIGEYDLKIIANANGISKEIVHQIFVKDCYDYSFVANDIQQNVCPCESSRFSFTITNNGEHMESYVLGVDGNYKAKVVLSQNSLTLASGESKEILAYVQSDCEDLGEYGFSVIVDPMNGRSIKSQNVKFVVDACYDFNVNTERDLVNMCEHSQENIQIRVRNDGSTTNNYNLKIDGPLWANLDSNNVQVSPNSEGIVNLVLAPDYGVEGSFQITFNAIPQKGNVQAINVFNVNVKKCYEVSVDIEKEQDKICNALENNYNVLIRNQGEFEKEFFVDIEGPSWVSLDKNSLSLSAGGEEQLTLRVAPDYDVEAKKYEVTVRVSARDSTKIADLDSISIETVTREECYDASINIEKDSVSVYYDSSGTIPVVIENNGADLASYSLDISGTASNFVYLNPSIVEIAPGSSEVVYLYMAPSDQINEGEYLATVSVRLEDTTIMASDSVRIKITDVPQEGDIYENQVDSPKKESIVTKFLNWIKSIFSRDSSEEEFFNNESSEENITEEEIINETESSEENDQESIEEEEEIEEINETEEEQEESETFESRATVYLGLSESTKFISKDVEHKISLSTKNDMSILLEINSETPIYVPLNIGDRKSIDLDDDGKFDVIITFNGFVGGKAEITYQVLDGYILQEGETSDEKPGFFSSFFLSLGNIFKGFFNFLVSYKFQLIALVVIVVLILLLVKTNLWKSILKFFEEEGIEEEKVVVGETKEEEKKIIEPKKEEKKKETIPKKEVESKKQEKESKKKKEEEKKKPVEEEEDEFVIEFDDD